MQTHELTGSWSAPNRGRSAIKTFVGAFALALIPIVGWSMATMYVITRKEPDRYDAGQAAGAGMLLAVYLFVGWIAVWFVVRVIAVTVGGG